MNETETRAELIDPAPHVAGCGVVEAGRTPRSNGKLNEKHLNEFVRHVPPGAIQDPGSKLVPRTWAACTGLGNDLPASTQKRMDLLNLAGNATVPTEAVCWSVLAWGGMHGRHRNALYNSSDQQWLAAADELRCGHFDRGSAYAAFHELRSGGKLPGMGPAYFTKLLFFLMPRQGGSRPGYIMDQWVGCSINLLVDRQVVLMDYIQSWKRSKQALVFNSTYVVSDANDADNYEDYCCQIEAVASEIGRDPADTELLLMSEGGHSKHPWRNYVIDNRRISYE